MFEPYNRIRSIRVIKQINFETAWNVAAWSRLWQFAMDVGLLDEVVNTKDDCIQARIRAEIHKEIKRVFGYSTFGDVFEEDAYDIYSYIVFYGKHYIITHIKELREL